MSRRLHQLIDTTLALVFLALLLGVTARAVQVWSGG
jgi:hypothetical protein